MLSLRFSASDNPAMVAASAFGVFADRTKGPKIAGEGSIVLFDVTGSQLSTIAWALAPPKPKLLTLALRGDPSGSFGHCVNVVGTSKCEMKGSIVGLSLVK